MFKQQIYNLIKKSLEDMGVKEIPDFSVFYPPEAKFGDYSTNIAMILAKALKKSSLEIAKEIELRIRNRELGIFEKIEVIPPGFMNFYLKQKVVQENLSAILKQKGKYGRLKIGKGKTIAIDYSAPNIAKMMHVGHLRSTIIGQAIYNIYEFLGYKTIGDNHIGDWGTQFGKLIYAYKNFADKEKLKEHFIEEISRLYVDFNTKAKDDSKLNDCARAETKKFQEGDKENMRIWKYFVRESMKEFVRIYKMLGVKIDYTLGESFYQPMLGEVISEALEKGIAVHSEGAVIIPLDKYDLPPYMIRKSDGATLYGTTDLATIKYRVEKWNPEKIIYVVANEQSGHLAQLFRAAEIMGYIKPRQAVHVKFGMVLGPDGKKFSTREGRVVLLEELLGEAISRAYKTVKEKNPDLPEAEKKKIAKAVGIGAIKYNDLSQNRLTDITFNWDKMLDFQGNSAPYLQYTYARIKSILRRAKTGKNLEFDSSLLQNERELAILRQLVLFDEIIERAGKDLMPNIIAEYLYNLANSFNTFYELVPVLKAEKDLKNSRLNLILGVATVIKNGLNLLGIGILERM